MSPKLQPVRGTHDILPEEFERFYAVVTRARELATLYGFKEMATPIFESTDVFSRSMGETSDVVSKEMFTFETKGDDSVTLRPEFTAGIIRAFISNGMQQHLPLKLFSCGPVFRYERPQKGRQRQFHQVNYEWLGDASPEADVETIALAAHLIYYICGKQPTLLINTLGDAESREKYRNALVAYLTPLAGKLSEDSKRRLEKNPLRILDSKDLGDKEIIANAPRVADYLNAVSKEHFEAVRKGLESISKEALLIQEIKIESSLVRGLDYYTGTVFEFVSSEGDLGAQNTVLAGGRYDGLVEQMGGNATPAIGFAAGVERLLLLEKDELGSGAPDIKIILMPMEGIPSGFVHSLAEVLRNRIMLIATEKRLMGLGRQYSVEILWNGKLGKRLEKAAKMNATHALIMGEEEMQRSKAVLKDMKTGTQTEVSIELKEMLTMVESLIK
jgi:histidyl-tRNA synthetase